MKKFNDFSINESSITNVFIVHETLSGTPESNRIHGVYATKEGAEKEALNLLTSKSAYNLSEKKAKIELKKGYDSDYVYIQKYKLEK